MGRRAISLALCMLAACEIQIAQRADDDDSLTQPVCGNGIVEGSEVCDDGNTADGDGCNATCSSDEGCGNGVIDESINETCDDGNLLGGDGCSADCASDETCGNGVIDLAKGETCDDNNLESGDGCSANCQSNESCGNSVTDSGTDPPEECDAGPAGSAECDVNCTTAFCGDFTVNTLRGETCDAGPNGSAQCDTDCTAAVCGDGTTNTLRGEQCDDGNSVTTDACISCKNAVCGDGFVRAGVEQCDDANANVTDACTVNCKAAFCGDGFVRAGVEQCDGGPGCNANCKYDPRVYVVTDPAMLINQTSVCSASVVYDSCAIQPTGFSWIDSSPFTPSSITIELDTGVNCIGPETLSTNLNGGASGSFTTGQVQCTCAPVNFLASWSFSNPGTYNVGGVNTINISASQSCFGYSTNLMGAFARITVFP